MTEGTPETKQLAVRYLRSMRELISTEDLWCKEAEAVDNDGIKVSATADRASARCLIGAYYKALWDHQAYAADDAQILLRRYLADAIPKRFHMFVAHERDIKVRDPSLTFIRFNDSHCTTHKKVLKAIDKAVQTLEGEQG